MLLPDTPITDAAKIVEEVLAAINSLGIERARSKFAHVTSIGLASWGPEEDSEAGAVIKAADEALYDAKATGRNKIVRFRTPC